jgi:hypothetical protein
METWELISLIATAERRAPKKQAEWLLMEVAPERAAQYDREYDEDEATPVEACSK